MAAFGLKITYKIILIAAFVNNYLSRNAVTADTVVFWRAYMRLKPLSCVLRRPKAIVLNVKFNLSFSGDRWWHYVRGSNR